MEDNTCEEIAIEINFDDIYNDNGVRKSEKTNLPLNGKYEDEDGNILHFKNGIFHNENGPAYINKKSYKAYYINNKLHRIDGPAVIYSDGDYVWYINDKKIDKETMDNWLKENDIPIDWNTWTKADKMLFALHWSDYNTYKSLVFACVCDLFVIWYNVLKTFKAIIQANIKYIK